MAWALRGSQVTQGGDNVNHTVTLTTHAADDVLINVAAVNAMNATYSINATPPSGWTRLYGPATGGYTYIVIDAKIATSSSETNPVYNIGASQTFSCMSSAWTGGPTTLTGIAHASNVAENADTVHPYTTPSLTVTENNTLILYATTLSNDAWTQSGSSYPNSCTGLCVANADVNNPLLYANLGLLVGYTIQTTAANVSASSWTNGGSNALRYRSLAVSLLAGSASTSNAKRMLMLGVG